MSTDAALERKLRPLYEAIDGRQFKQALKLAAAALQASTALLISSVRCAGMAQRHILCTWAIVKTMDNPPALRHAQKYPNNQLIRALKSVTLQRMGGRDEEALELADEVAKETPTDEQVLYTLGLTWQGAGKLKASAL